MITGVRSSASPDGGSQTALRQANERRVLEALQSAGAMSQATLARATGLSRQTVNNVVRALTAAGDVEVTAGANGRETQVSLRATVGAVIGVDLGYQTARAALVEFPGGRRTDRQVGLSAAREAASDDVDAIVGLVEELMAVRGATTEDVLGLGLSIPQPYDARTRRIAPTPLMPGWAAEPLVQVLTERLGIEVVADNDANAAAVAEAKWGAGRDCPDLVYVMAAYGLGAGIISDGRLFRGGTGMAGEIGHVTIDDRGPVCTCGKRGDLSSLASGRALVGQMRALGDTSTTLDGLIAGARSGEVFASRLIADAGRYIGMALAHVVGILGPSRVVLGGPLAAAGGVLSDPIEAALGDMVISPMSGRTELVRSPLDADAALLGAIALVVEAQGIGTEALPSWARPAGVVPA
ncbi:ROK family transcriptional regulator [Blastococcus sp. SYSU D00820]